jgi:hypothetical protein
MVENHAAIMAPFYNTNPNVKQYFDKLFKIKNEQILLNINLIAEKNKIPVHDTIWRFFSTNSKTKLQTYDELKKLKLLNKIDLSKLSQEDFCKTRIANSIEFDLNADADENSSLKQKAKADSLIFNKKVEVKNNREEGFIYFFDRVDSQTKIKSLAYAFVKKQKDDALTTSIDITDTKRVIEIGKTMEETIKSICSEFYYKNRLRYIPENSYSNSNNYYGDY